MANSVKAKTPTENSRKNNKIVKDVISNLTNARDDFNSAETEYQSAKHKIYNVLSVVFDQYVALKSADKAKAVRELFEKKVKELKDDQSIVATQATSLELLVLRVVIGNAFKQEREKVYARVLRLALAEKIHEDAELSFVDWIVGAGGIEEVRRSDAKATSSQEKVKAARAHYNAALSALSVSVPKSVEKKFVSATTNADDDFVVALVRKSSMTIVATTDSQSAVSATLKSLGKNFKLEEVKRNIVDAEQRAKAKAKAANSNFASSATTASRKVA
jgi:hypothetical protein